MAFDFSLITDCTFFTERNPGDKSCDANLRTWIFAVCVCTRAARTETRGRRYSTDKSQHEGFQTVVGDDGDDDNDDNNDDDDDDDDDDVEDDHDDGNNVEEFLPSHR